MLKWFPFLWALCPHGTHPLGGPSFHISSANCYWESGFFESDLSIHWSSLLLVHCLLNQTKELTGLPDEWLCLCWELLAKPSESFCCQTNLITGQMEIKQLNKLNNCLDFWLAEIESLKHLSSTISLFPCCSQAPLNNDTMKIWCTFATGVLEMLQTLQTPLDSTAEL